jgi:hypothetical protein
VLKAQLDDKDEAMVVESELNNEKGVSQVLMSVKEELAQVKEELRQERERSETANMQFAEMETKYKRVQIQVRDFARILRYHNAYCLDSQKAALEERLQLVNVSSMRLASCWCLMLARTIDLEHR